jgi:hypothetical protein
MGHADAGVHAAIDAQRGQDFSVGRDAGLEHSGREAVERQRRIAAQVAVEPPRDPPQARAQHASRQQEREPQQQQHMRKLVAKFPRTDFAEALYVPSAS